MMPNRRMLRQSVLVIAACLSAATLHPASANVAGDAALPTAQGGTKSISQLRGGLQAPAARAVLRDRNAPAAARAPLAERDVADLSGARRDIAIFTTAALPWMTGTSINPMLRAWALAGAPERHAVTLCVPFLGPEDQDKVFPPGAPRFASPAEQRGYLEQWTRAHIHAGRADPRFEVAFYSGRWVAEIGAIIPSGDIIGECVPDAARRDVALLEEPEHLNWYKVQPFKRSFVFVAGVVHTNYLAYRLRDAHVPEPVRELWAAGFELLGREVAAAACHRIVKLSDAVGEWHGAVTENVHGVRPHFLAVGDALRAAALAAGGPAPAVRFRGGAYYIGKALWTKGYRELLDVCAGHKARTGRNVPLTLFGDGPDLAGIKREAAAAGLDWRFEGAIDHGDARLEEFGTLINPSTSDVVCTTSAEALAMNKRVVCPQHPSNVFFARFRNTLTYPLGDAAALDAALEAALGSDPLVLSPEEQQDLTWASATQRLYAALAPPAPPAPPSGPPRDALAPGREKLSAARLASSVASSVASAGRPAAGALARPAAGALPAPALPALRGAGGADVDADADARR